MTRKLKIILLIVCVFIAFLIGISIGGAQIPIRHIIYVFLNRLADIPIPEEVEKMTPGLIWNIRLPRVFLSFIVGSALAVSGSVLQSVLKNPLASSYTLGVSSGAGLGAVIVIVFGIYSTFLGMFLMPVVAITFAMSTIFLAMSFASHVSHRLDDHSIVLVGVVLSIFINALMMTIASQNSHHAEQILRWQLGSFSLIGWPVVRIILFVVLFVIFWITRYVKEMDILTFGDEQASSIGIEVKKTKWMLMVLSSILTGVVVAFVGIIGFVDLIAPHVVRRFFGSEHKYVILLSALFGGIFMLFADSIARTIIAPSELPVGTVTALIGTPFFAYIFLKNRKNTGG